MATLDGIELSDDEEQSAIELGIGEYIDYEPTELTDDDHDDGPEH